MVNFQKLQAMLRASKAERTVADFCTAIFYALSDEELEEITGISPATLLVTLREGPVESASLRSKLIRPQEDSTIPYVPAPPAWLYEAVLLAMAHHGRIFAVQQRNQRTRALYYLFAPKPEDGMASGLTYARGKGESKDTAG